MRAYMPLQHSNSSHYSLKSHGICPLPYLFKYMLDLYAKDKGNYSLNNDVNSGNPIISTKILLNNVKLVDLDGTYTNYVIPYERYSSTPSDGVNIYSFNLNNFLYQPSGSLNFSMLDRVEMQMQLDSNLTTNSNTKVLVFANSYNILRIMSGLAGLAFIE